MSDSRASSCCSRLSAWIALVAYCATTGESRGETAAVRAALLLPTPTKLALAESCSHELLDTKGTHVPPVAYGDGRGEADARGLPRARAGTRVVGEVRPEECESVRACSEISCRETLTGDGGAGARSCANERRGGMSANLDGQTLQSSGRAVRTGVRAAALGGETEPAEFERMCM